MTDEAFPELERWARVLSRESVEPVWSWREVLFVLRHNGLRVVREAEAASVDSYLAPPLTRERLAAALRPGHLFEHPGHVDECPERDGPASLAMADAILAALTPTSAPEPGS